MGRSCSKHSVEQEAVENVTVEEIKTALRELSERDYSILYPYLFEHLKPKEIAAKLGISENSIYVYIKRARKHFMKILKRKGIDYDV